MSRSISDMTVFCNPLGDAVGSLLGLLVYEIGLMKSGDKYILQSEKFIGQNSN